MGGNFKEGGFLKTCILISVWPDYDWLLPILKGMLAESWPGHPELVFSKNVGDGRNWTKNLAAGVADARDRGFDSAYLINEEHVPVGHCNVDYLTRKLPRQATELGAEYVSLFGWDNKRFCSRSPVLDFEKGMWMHLIGKKDPRFHLHPAWWKLDALEACCRLTLKDDASNGSAWRFEKTCDNPNADLPEHFQTACYQISASATRISPLQPLAISLLLSKRWLANKAMAVLPHLREGPLRTAWLKVWNFDDVISDGAYPMVFSGVLAKGKLNPAFIKHSQRSEFSKKWMQQISGILAKNQAC